MLRSKASKPTRLGSRYLCRSFFDTSSRPALLYTTGVFQRSSPCSRISAFVVEKRWLGVVRLTVRLGHRLFGAPGQDAEVKQIRERLDREGCSDGLDLSAFAPETVCSALISFFDELPEPLVGNLYGAFMQTVKQPKEDLQLDEIKALLRQLTDTNRRVLLFTAASFHGVLQHEEKNNVTKRMLTQKFAHVLVRGPEPKENLREKIKLLNLVIDRHADLLAATGSMQRRACAPAPLAVASAAESSAAVSPRSLVPVSDDAGAEMREAALALPGLVDEGLVAVQELVTSNEAVQALLRQLNERVAQLEAAQQVPAKVAALEQRCAELEEKCVSLAEEVEAHGSPPVVASQSDAGGNMVDQELRSKVDSLFQTVQTRLEDLEAEVGVGDDEERKSIGRSETERMIKIAVDDAQLRAESGRQEAFSKWRATLEEEIQGWKRELTESVSKDAATEAADAVKAAIKDALKDLPKTETRASLAADDNRAEALQVLTDEVARLKTAAESAEAAETRLSDRVDDLMRAVEENSSCLKDVEGDQEVQLNRVNQLQGKVEALEQGAAAAPQIDSLHERVAELATRLSEVRAGTGSSSGAELAGANSGDPLLDKIEKMEQGLAKLGGEVQAQLESLQAQVKLAADARTADGSKDDTPAALPAGSGPAGLEAQVDEAFGRLFEQVVNPEIVSLREASHALARLVGQQPAGGDEEEDGADLLPGQTTSVLTQLARLAAAVQDSQSAALQLDALAARTDRTTENLADLEHDVRALRKEVTAAAAAAAALTPPAKGSAGGAFGAAGLEEMRKSIQALEAEVSRLRAGGATGVGDEKGRIGSQMAQLEERVDDMHARLEGLSAAGDQASGGRDEILALQTEQDGLKKQLQLLRSRLDEVSAAAKHAQEKAGLVEQRTLREVEESETALEELTKQVDIIAKELAAGHGAVGAGGGGSAELASKLCTRLSEQVRGLEERVEFMGAAQRSHGEKLSDAAASLRRLEQAAEQLEVHRGAVYASGPALDALSLKVKETLQRLAQAAPQSADSSRAPELPVAAHASASGGAGDWVRFREQLAVLRAEMDAGLLRCDSALDVQGRSVSRTEGLARQLETLVRQTRDELSAEVEQERAKGIETESKARKAQERLKKQVDEVLEEVRGTAEALGEQLDGAAKLCRKVETSVTALAPRVEALEAEAERLASVAAESERGGTGPAEGGPVSVQAVAELDRKLAGVAAEAHRGAACHEQLAELRAELSETREEVRRCAAGVLQLGDGTGSNDASQVSGGGGSQGTPQQQQRRRRAWREDEAVSSSEGERAEQEARELVRGARLQGRQQHRMRRGSSRRRSASPSVGARRRDSSSPRSAGRGGSRSDSRDGSDDSRSRAGLPRPRPASAAGQLTRSLRPASASGFRRGEYGDRLEPSPARGWRARDSAGFGSSTYRSAGGGRGLDRAVERELSHLKRMFGL